jgi:4-amino-4-deoxy-L-arabinose transferase-like glycosyltransferase
MSYKWLTATRLLLGVNGWPAYSPAALTVRTSCAFYTMIYLIFRKNQIKSIIEIGLAGVREADFRR